MTNQFDMDEVIKALREGRDLTGKDGVLMPLIKQNRRNGKTSKNIKTGSGSFEFKTPVNKENWKGARHALLPTASYYYRPSSFLAPSTTITPNNTALSMVGADTSTLGSSDTVNSRLEMKVTG